MSTPPITTIHSIFPIPRVNRSLASTDPLRSTSPRSPVISAPLQKHRSSPPTRRRCSARAWAANPCRVAAVSRRSRCFREPGWAGSAHPKVFAEQIGAGKLRRSSRTAPREVAVGVEKETSAEKSMVLQAWEQQILYFSRRSQAC